MGESLATAMPKEQARVRELVQRYREPILHGAGELTARLMELSLQRADQAVMSGDVTQMLVAYQDLQSWER